MTGVFKIFREKVHIREKYNFFKNFSFQILKEELQRTSKGSTKRERDSLGNSLGILRTETFFKIKVGDPNPLPFFSLCCQVALQVLK